MARNTPTISVKARGKEFDLDLDDTVFDQLAQQFGLEEDRGLDDDIDPDMKVQITDFGDLDAEAMGGTKWSAGLLGDLGAAMADHGDPDQVQAAWLRVMDNGTSAPDADDIKKELENLTWQGKVREDEKDYAQYVIDEGLMDAKALTPYFDAEKFGSDALMDSRTTVLKDGRIIVWNE
jgi:hypothetical protein